MEREQLIRTKADETLYHANEAILSSANGGSRSTFVGKRGRKMGPGQSMEHSINTVVELHEGSRAEGVNETLDLRDLFLHRGDGVPCVVRSEERRVGKECRSR